jgi:uroporphyrinogen-III synthase
MTPDRPLAGKTIICTFPPTENNDFTTTVEPLVATVLWLPTIEVVSLSFVTPQPIADYHWMVFTSKNGVKAFFEKQRPLPHQQIAVLGASTAKEIQKLGINAAFVGSGTSGETFADELINTIPADQRALIVLGNLAPNTIIQKLSSKIKTDRVDVYQTTTPKQMDGAIIDIIRQGKYDAIVFSSPSAFQNLCPFLGQPLPPLKAISIGSTTTAAIRQAGIEPKATASEQSYKGLAEAAIHYLTHKTTQQ